MKRLTIIHIILAVAIVAIAVTVVVAAVIGEKQEPNLPPTPQEQVEQQKQTPIKDGDTEKLRQDPDQLRDAPFKEKVEEKGKELEKMNDPGPVGGAQNYSCRTDYIRTGPVRSVSSILMDALHYTVSANRKGWGDVYAIRNYFRSVQADSTYILDFEGHCLKIKPDSAIPWTQGSFNSVTRSYEIIATGRETRAQWMASPLIRDGILASLIRDNMRKTGLPLTLVDPVGCTPKRGLTDHNRLECRNDHHDVAPNLPIDFLVKQIRGANTIPSKVTVWCRKANWYRDEVRKNHKVTPEQNRLYRERLALVGKAGYNCSNSGPVKK